MTVRLLAVVGMGLLLAACGQASAQPDSLVIDVSGEVAKVRFLHFEGVASRIIYDASKGVLVLEGSTTQQATLYQRQHGGRAPQHHAGNRISYSFRDGQISGR